MTEIFITKITDILNNKLLPAESVDDLFDLMFAILNHAIESFRLAVPGELDQPADLKIPTPEMLDRLSLAIAAV